MLKKYSILYGIIIPILLLVATMYCQGRVPHNENSVGYDWKNNRQTDSLNEKAVNASNNCIPVLGYVQDVVLMRQIRFVPF